jgi:diguanylate cyclase (GGDEF)-like protein
MGPALAVAVVVAVAAVVVAVLSHRRRRAAERRAVDAEAGMHAAQAEYGALTVKVEELERRRDDALHAVVPIPGEPLTDAVTGLPGEQFFAVTLNSRVAAARRHLRPVAVVLLEVVESDGEASDPVLITSHLSRTVREADIACRLEEAGCFAMVLEDTPENGAVWTVERFRRSLAASGGSRVVRAGIACYPAHAFDADELLERASGALVSARQWRQDRIEVATVTET